ncbi:MAG: gliding motility-associated C-terminal domain-containing protein [Saprospiraceae bacterium]|nr:gliding motility-associated C-terminal domain-containing protein [Candidatus Parvibacillus calidus]
MNTQRNKIPLGIDRLLFIFLFVLSFFALNAQFKIAGNASKVSEQCYDLTPDAKSQEGYILSRQKINLREDFTISVTMNFGRQNNTTSGADGIAFVMMTDTVISSSGLGGGIGYLGTSPSLIVEFDTYQNSNYNDPADDHVALIRNGNPDHASNNTISGPFSLGSNIEDLNNHNVVFSWKADIQEFTVYFDCIKVLGYVGPIAGPFLGGETSAYWGFTASTGNAYNRQTVCFNTPTYVDELQDLIYCDPATVQLDGGPNGLSYKWTPESGLSNPYIARPTVTVNETTTFYLEKISTCGKITLDSMQVEIIPNTIQLDLGADTSICIGNSLQLSVQEEGANYHWTTGDTTQTITVDQGGIYSVEVDNGICKKQDSMSVSVILLPSITTSPDTIICRNTSAVLSASSNDSILTWSDGSTGTTITVNEEGSYTVSASNLCGQTEKTILVSVKNCEEFFIPNVFSPNHDGINDYFGPTPSEAIQLIERLAIFDRWGALLYEANNITANQETSMWDGTFRGRDMNPGVYAYLIQLKMSDGKVRILKGSVTLVR